ncbi:MAG TPA: HAD-IIIA family hydrolase [Gemmatimonadales bacterium]
MDPLAPFKLWIFDADDTLRRTTVPGQPCPRAPGEWELLPGVRDRLAALPWQRDGGPYFGLASNQDQVGAGLFTRRMARDLLRDLARAAIGQAPPDPALQLCPHPLGVACDCRKPGPRMLVRVMAFYGVGPRDTIFVGDSESDRRAAAAAGVRFLDARELFGWDQQT